MLDLVRRSGEEGPADWEGPRLERRPSPLNLSLDLRSFSIGGLSLVGVPLDGFLLNKPPLSRLGVDRLPGPVPSSASSVLSFLPTAAPIAEVARCSMLTVLTEADLGFVAGLADWLG